MIEYQAHGAPWSAGSYHSFIHYHFTIMILVPELTLPSPTIPGQYQYAILAYTRLVHVAHE